MLDRPKKIISGGQTGADIGGLVAAEKLGIPTGGVAPGGWKTEAGPQPILGARFGLTEATTADYLVRTRLNVEDSDATLIFCRKLEGGSKQTERLAIRLKKPFCVVDPWSKYAVRRVQEFLCLVQPQRLNIAGRRESKEPGIAKQVCNVIVQAIHRLDYSPDQNKENKEAPLDFNPEQAIKIAADSLETLRRADVFRVLDTCGPEHYAVLANYIKSGRPDLAEQVGRVLEDLEGTPGPSPR